MSERIIVPLGIYQQIIAHACEGAPDEVCGILSGAGNRATGLVRAINEATNRRMDYWIDGATLLRQVDFEEHGEAMIAIYHSHPASEAYPSAADAANAYYPDAIYLICSLEQPERPIVRGFRLIVERLTQRPGRLSAVRNHPALWAHLHRGDQHDYYDLAIVEDDGHERWQRVHVVELPVVAV